MLCFAGSSKRPLLIGAIELASGAGDRFEQNLEHYLSEVELDRHL